MTKEDVIGYYLEAEAAVALYESAKFVYLLQAIEAELYPLTAWWETTGKFLPSCGGR